LYTDASFGILLLGGNSVTSVSLVTAAGKECSLSEPIHPIPQAYGAPGRIGAVAGYDIDADRVLFCGGLDSGGSPPFSSFRDCQVLDMKTR
jgi:hypothetical protein